MSNNNNKEQKTATQVANEVGVRKNHAGVALRGMLAMLDMTMDDARHATGTSRYLEEKNLPRKEWKKRKRRRKLANATKQAQRQRGGKKKSKIGGRGVAGPSKASYPTSQQFKYLSKDQVHKQVLRLRRKRMMGQITRTQLHHQLEKLGV